MDLPNLSFDLFKLIFRHWFRLFLIGAHDNFSFQE